MARALGVLGLFWYARGQGQSAGGVVLDNGLRSPMPVIEIGPPLWVYFLAGILGAFVAAGIAFAALGATTDQTLQLPKRPDVPLMVRSAIRSIMQFHDAFLGHRAATTIHHEPSPVQ